MSRAGLPQLPPQVASPSASAAVLLRSTDGQAQLAQSLQQAPHSTQAVPLRHLLHEQLRRVAAQAVAEGWPLACLHQGWPLVAAACPRWMDKAQAQAQAAVV